MKINISLNYQSELALKRAQVLFMENGKKLKNKEELINEVIRIFDKSDKKEIEKHLIK